MLTTTLFAYGNGLGTCDALLFRTLQSALEIWQEATIVHLISVQPVKGLIIRAVSMALICGYWRFCVVYTDTVSVKPITAHYGV